MMNFRVVHVLNEDDLKSMIEYGDCTCFEDIDVSTADFNWDYAEMALLDEDKKMCILWNDNIHTHIEEEINAFIDGLRYSGRDIHVEETVMMADTIKEIYSGARY